ncbi:MAG: PadR family transcriptional regulator [Stellaceae bacterium]
MHLHHHLYRYAARQAHYGARGGGFAPPGRGGRRRLFDAGELRLVLLKLIEERPRHGYDLIRELEARSGGAYVPSAGVVYPTIALLLDMGLVEEAGDDPARKLVAISAAGRAHLAEHQAEFAAAWARLEAVAELRERTDAAPILRAMQNLKAALRNRLSQDGLEKKIIFDAAGLIDEAAGKIERL